MVVLCTVLSTQSCKDECKGVVCQNEGICDDGTCDCPEGFLGANCEIQDPCFGITCENEGTCIDGTCECLDGYIGTSCENFDLTQVQVLLDGGITPEELLNGNVPLENLYGKTYAGGIIFYVNTDGAGKVVALTDAVNILIWEEAITYCNNLVSEGKNDWFLPSKDELNLMWTNLADSDGNNQNIGPNDSNNLGGFGAETYWSSTENGNLNAWTQNFSNGSQVSHNKNTISGFIRAARAF